MMSTGVWGVVATAGGHLLVFLLIGLLILLLSSSTIQLVVLGACIAGVQFFLRIFSASITNTDCGDRCVAEVLPRVLQNETTIATLISLLIGYVALLLIAKYTRNPERHS